MLSGINAMLPFKVAPTKKYETVDVGNEEIGILAIEKYENLTPVERRFIKEQNLYNYTFELATLAKRISRETGAHFAYVNDRINAYLFGGVIQNDMVKVKSRSDIGKVADVTPGKDAEGNDTDLITVLFDDETGEIERIDDIELVSPDWYADYYSDISALTTAYIESLPMQNYVYACAIIRFRLDPSWTLEQTLNPDEIDYELVCAIANFAYQEKNGWAKAEPKQPSTDEELGKSSTASKNPTGKESTGDSNATGDMTPDSTTETSPSSPSA
jgi:hypothetical protein